DVVDEVDPARRVAASGQREGGGVGGGVDEAEAEERRAAAADDDRGRLRDALGAEGMRRSLLRSDGVILDERSAEVRERIEDAAGARGEARDQAPAAAAGDGRVVARRAGALVEDGAEAVDDVLDLGGVAAVVGKRRALRGGETGQRIARQRCRLHAALLRLGERGEEEAEANDREVSHASQSARIAARSLHAIASSL